MEIYDTFEATFCDAPVKWNGEVEEYRNRSMIHRFEWPIDTCTLSDTANSETRQHGILNVLEQRAFERRFPENVFLKDRLCEEILKEDINSNFKTILS
ncbi:hypothetical protein RRG08_046330 [Elysia crispata]|uniref:Uncharacterized protein n=1 Tax=Elysia crispata TaxID=231223 RepID=A0AAE1A5H3_9GAST|nr:hypothetical protein RRG08_046330 [Elysia crispata]